MDVKILLIGCGQVGIQLLHLIQEKHARIAEKYNLTLSVVGIVDSSGGAFLQDGLSIEKLTDIKKKTHKVSHYPKYGYKNLTVEDLLDEVKTDVVIDAGISKVIDHQVDCSYLNKAIQLKNDLVFLNKGPLVAHFPQLKRQAMENDVRMKVSGATAAALPTVDLMKNSLAGTTILRVEGILNGTTNYILDEMAQGKTYKEALKQAQEIGIAETDPTNDVEGYDTAAKIVILANAVMNVPLTMRDITIEGITTISAEQIQRAKERNKVLKLIGEIENLSKGLKASVKVQQLDNTHPLATVHNEEKGIRLETDSMGELTVIGGKSDPRAAAAAALKDVILLYKGRTWDE